jgi:hypothetical protein
MTYKDKFEESEKKAHNSLIATKIFDRIEELNAESDKNEQRRWIWELLQNAKDVAPDNQQVSAEINILNQNGTKSVSFSHNGQPFTVDNIMFLIKQVSTKDRKEEENINKPKTTGKFGTGFLTTHLLSKKVEVSGVVKEPDLDFRSFRMPLDRSGRKLEDIIESVNNSISVIDTLDLQQPLTDYNPIALNTTFLYNIDEEGYNVAKIGIEDLHLSIPYALAFLPNIKSVTIKHEEIVYEISKIDNLTSTIKYFTIHKRISSQSTEINIVTIEKNNTTIAIEIEQSDNKTCLKKFAADLPKIFCDFPLIGTNDFTLPFVINSSNFNPTKERYGVVLTDKNDENVLENKDIFANSVELYFELLDFAIENKWENLFLLANTETPIEKKWFSKSWFVENIQKPIRKGLLHKPIINNISGERVSVLASDNTPNIWFPSSSNAEVREKIWELCKNWIPQSLPQKNEIHDWYNIIWSDCSELTLKVIGNTLQIAKDIDSWEKKLKLTNEETIVWLNEYYDLLNFEGKFIADIISDNYSVIPNQKGVFKKSTELKKDINIEEELKNVLEILGVDLRDKLRHKEIETASKYNEEKKGQIPCYPKTQDEVIDEINKILEEGKKPNSGNAISYLISLFSEDEAFPKHRETLYRFCSELIPNEIPERKIIGQWTENIWKNADEPRTARLIIIISECKNLVELTKRLEKANNDETIAWLNSFLDFLDDRNYKEKLNKYPILPNQKGEFLIKDELHIDDGSIDEELKDILELLGSPIREKLLYKQIQLELPKDRERDIQFAAIEIYRLIKPRFSEIPRTDETKRIFKSLYLWLNKDKARSKTIFEDLYKIKPKLYDDDEIAENMQKAEQLDSIMEEFNISDAEELKSRLNQGNNDLVAFFRDQINDGEEDSIYKKALGFIIDKLKEVNINSVDDFLLLIDNIKAGNILIRSNPNPINQTTIGTRTPEEKKEYAIQLTSEAIGSTIRHIQNLGYEILFEKYNKDYPTVFIVKYKDHIFDLVIRPCHFNRYKIYSHEKEILKNENAELWLSDGIQVMKETLYNLMFRIFDSGAIYIPTKPFVPGRLIG